MSKYLLILRDHEMRWDQFSAEELRRVVDMFAEWNDELREAGQFAGAGKLTSDRGVTVRNMGEELFVDGPYAEAKEAIAGYYSVTANNLEEAIAAAEGCPILTYGGSIEVREMVSSLSD